MRSNFGPTLLSFQAQLVLLFAAVAFQATEGIQGPLAAPPFCGEVDGQTIVNLIASDFEGARAVIGSDMDGDGYPDVMASGFTDSYQNHKIVMFLNINDGEAFSLASEVSSFSAATSLFAADINGNGRKDVVGGNSIPNELSWFENKDYYEFSYNSISSTTNSAHAVFAIDMDGDGDVDVVTINSSDNSNMAWYENLDGKGSFSSTLHVIQAGVTGGSSVFAIDIDGDGDADVVSSTSNKVAWYRNIDGKGTFSTENVITTQVDDARSVFSIDIDGDGDADVLSASFNDDKIAWYENLDGNGTFSSQYIITTQADGATSVFAIDLENDGDVDVLSASYNDNKIAWYKNHLISLECNSHEHWYHDDCACGCDTGYNATSSGVCEDINECDTVCVGGIYYSCTNTDGSFICSCQVGFDYNYATDSCDDVNECTSQCDGSNTICINAEGSFTCSCDVGYNMTSFGVCEDVDECDTLCVDGGASCSNTAGSFICDCAVGFEYDYNTDSCQDIDECSSQCDGNHTICTNTNGSFTCSCDAGYNMAFFGVCQDMADSECFSQYSTCVDPQNSASGPTSSSSTSSPSWYIPVTVCLGAIIIILVVVIIVLAKTRASKQVVFSDSKTLSTATINPTYSRRDSVI
eukprot:m.12075 g.12075  ORF g.12075 m.12075 type:complete len:636 (+) comp3950_c0_seq1:203-2110(+)